MFVTPEQLQRQWEGLPHLAWHVTPRANLQGIIEAGALLPKLPRVATGHNQRPAVFFTMNADMAHASHHGEAENEWLRFGYPEQRLLRPGEWLPMFSINPLFEPSWEEGSVRQIPGAKLLYKMWRVSFKPLPVGDFSLIQATDDGGETWRTVWLNPALLH